MRNTCSSSSGIAMVDTLPPVTASLMALGHEAKPLSVALSHELVGLLSNQLYHSPAKAIEELVVNAYDADANGCYVFVPQDQDDKKFVIVADNGSGMDEAGLTDLWHIGRSKKRDAELEKLANRKQIGKFGIGKLATYVIAEQVTYLSKKGDATWSVTLNFSQFKSDPEGGGTSIPLPLRKIDDTVALGAVAPLTEALASVGVNLSAWSAVGDWTIVILENLKPKVFELRLGWLRWLLSTAMPLRPDFRLFLNGTEVVSSKEDYDVVAQFDVMDLPKERIKAIAKASGVTWKIATGKLVAKEFPEGVTGGALVTKQSLYATKSDDLSRSNGYFVRVRERLVNEDDALFGLKPLSFQTFNRFRADLNIDDLDKVLTAPREGVEQSELRRRLEPLLEAIFYEARDRYKQWQTEQDQEEGKLKEHERRYINARLVEYPTADILTLDAGKPGAEADKSWFYVKVDADVDPREVARNLYANPRAKYTYSYMNLGRSGRIVEFDPAGGIFRINLDHDLVKAHGGEDQTLLLEDLATAEALLEIYLRESDVPASVVGDVLERRDALLRSLSNDHMYSLESISQLLLDSAQVEHDLEIALVTSARALGFVATHISGTGTPDGVARLTDYPNGETTITLEAKSTGATPSLAHLDFAGIEEHMNDERYNAQGCLLLAPVYPGQTKKKNAVATRAREAKVSCWTVKQLSAVVAAAEARQITAARVLRIILSNFAPADVAVAVDGLLKEPAWDQQALYIEILVALRALDTRLKDAARTVDHLAAEISRNEDFAGVSDGDIEAAVRELAGASQGALNLRDRRLIIHTSMDEIERRVRGLTGVGGKPRRLGGFKAQ